MIRSGCLDAVQFGELNADGDLGSGHRRRDHARRSYRSRASAGTNGRRRGGGARVRRQRAAAGDAGRSRGGAPADSRFARERALPALRTLLTAHGASAYAGRVPRGVRAHGRSRRRSTPPAGASPLPRRRAIDGARLHAALVASLLSSRRQAARAACDAGGERRRCRTGPCGGNGVAGVVRFARSCAASGHRRMDRERMEYAFAIDAPRPTAPACCSRRRSTPTAR